MTHQLRWLPQSALRRYCGPYIGYDLRGEPGRHRGVPSGWLTVVLAFDRPTDLAWLGEEAGRGRFWALASGLHTRSVDIRHDGWQHGIQLALTPWGCRALLGMPASALARDIVPLGEVLPRLDHEAIAAADWPERFRLLDRALMVAADRHSRPHVSPRPEVAQAWRLVRRTHGTVRVGDVAEELSWSRRHLSAQFRAEIGLTVKEAVKVTRFEYACGLLTSGVGAAEVAVRAGYADQSHLTREFGELAGYAPMEYLRAEFPFLQDSAGTQG